MNELLVRGRIDQDWAESVGESGWLRAFNDEYDNGKYYPGDKDLAAFGFKELGDLLVKCSRATYPPQAIGGLADYRKSLIINLAFDEPGRLTSTSQLLAAALEKNPEAARESLSRDSLLGRFVEDGNNTWILPESAVTLIEVEEPTVVTLPHQAI